MTEIEGAVSSPVTDQASAPSPDSTSPSTGDSGQKPTLDSIVAAAIKDASPEDAAQPVQGRKPRTRKSDQAAEGAPEANEPTPAGRQAEGDKPEAAAPDDEVKFPAKWDAKRREAVSKLDKAAQKVIVDLDREAEAAFTRKSQERAEELKFAQAVNGIITPEHRQQLQVAGLDVAGGIKRLLQYQDYAVKQPANYVKWFVREAKIDPRTLFPELAAGQPSAASGAQPQPSPAAAPQPRQQPQEPDPHINHLLGRFDRLEQWAQQQEQARVEYIETQALNEVARFKDAKDAGGNLLRPHFGQVEEVMARMLQSDPVLVEKKATDPVGALQDAYDTAVMLNPDLRRAVVDGEVRKQTESQRRAADVEKAKAARSPVSGSAPAAMNQRGTTIDDAVTYAMRQAGVV